MKQKSKAYDWIFIIVVAIIILSSNINAFAVSSQYYEGNPLYLQPGESTETFFTLQNLASTEDVLLQARITEGNTVTELTDSSNIYSVPAGEKTKVNFIVTAPANAKKGDTFPISMEFTARTSGEGSVGLSGSIGKGFNLAVGDSSDFEVQETKFPLITLYAITAIIVILAIITFVIIRKKFSKTKINKTKTNKF